MIKTDERELIVEEPSEGCADCPYAGWIDMYGKTIWGCDMQYCRLAAEEEEFW